MGDYDVNMSTETDFGKVVEILLNNFKNFFKKEISSILAWRLAKSVEILINQTLLEQEKSLDIQYAILNTTLIADPIFYKNTLVFPLDGSFISLKGADSFEDPEPFARMPIFVDTEHAP